MRWCADNYVCSRIDINSSRLLVCMFFDLMLAVSIESHKAELKNTEYSDENESGLNIVGSSLYKNIQYWSAVHS